MLNGKLLGNAFPINKVEVFFDDEDHSNFLGFQWERIGQGQMPIGLDTTDSDFNEIGKTGGEKEHTLTINEMPVHDHRLFIGYSGSNSVFVPEGSTKNSTWNTVSGTSTTETGGDQAHNNMPPYIVMAFWKRIA